MTEMTSTKPYFVRAIYQWILDNRQTPYIEVNAVLPHVSVPPRYIKDDKIVLDINPSAVNKFYMGLDAISFEARFDNKVLPLYVPIYAINAIFAAENGQGMSFPPESDIYNLSEETILETSSDITTEGTSSIKQTISPPPKKDKPKLTLVE